MEAILLIILLIAVTLPFFGSLVWIYRDAEYRGKPGILLVFLAAVCAWPLSLLVWIALRPPIVPPRRR